MKSAFSDRFTRFTICHEPETACDPRGPLVTRLRISVPLITSRLLLQLSVHSTVAEFPSDETVVFEVPTVFPIRLSVSSVVRSSTTLRRSEEHTSELQSRQY